ncbi:hypothetical protein POF50_015055 [Streptomyces sp. SL13]|jgi:ABC-type transporter Mla subunit MlaD|uniref:Uncharacterized protein n=1 Tax=Streptantibioticus silvisoli TaxID=2705255 RepID=A0AA90H4I1_9ACTN|nr:hypothetical protein [Streptantibioticus silvisoli]MDI5964253.1 hypothetical protein [Streptantibioticus silvisoli]MDI5970645.1 hypothetical protein [Streptantibioticus silvisoli]
MADLTVHSEVLDDLKRTFSHITQQMDAARKALSNADGTVVGAPSLIDAVHDYANDWKYGIGQIGQHTHSTVETIDQIGKTFDDADIKLANSLHKATK